MNAFDEEFLDQYREKIAQIKANKNKQAQLGKELTELHEQLCKLDNERNVMRRVITKMIEENIDSVDAKLQGDVIWAQDLWDEPKQTSQNQVAGIAGQSSVAIPTINIPTTGMIYPTAAAQSSLSSVWTTFTKYIGI